ncbi:hypothetical protein CYY_004900 [Polysphondylium violaceum]|uniref:FNIP repeat-containing protein n=1 Tax=Polysphondylium violaceum TaxID=133409 RepID=A0A8J4PUN9_9MYCE|nr:hypothetical protein CYY_004900 [Polysphondylium violaceum]
MLYVNQRVEKQTPSILGFKTKKSGIVIEKDDIVCRFNILHLIVQEKIDGFPKELEGVEFNPNKPYYKIGNIKKLVIHNFSKLPKGITHLTLRKELKKENVIPNSVVWLYLYGVKVLTPIFSNVQVKHLVIRTTSIQPHSIPPSVEILEFRSINQSIGHLKDVIPLTVKRIYLEKDYFAKHPIPEFLIQRNLLDQRYQIYEENTLILPTTNILIWRENKIIPCGVVPDNISTIIFGDKFNQTILKDSLPLSVREIIFGLGFSQCISNIYLPFNLKYLIFRGDYNNKIIPNSFPPFLSHVSFLSSSNFKYPMSLVNLPLSISHLNITSSFYPEELNNVLDIKHLILRTKSPVVRIGQSIKSIQTNAGISHSDGLEMAIIEKEEQIVRKEFPPNILLDLEVVDSILHHGSLNHLNVKTLRFNYFNHALPKGSIPESTERIYLSSNFNQQCFISPPNLKFLNFGTSYNQPLLKEMLPETLEELILSRDFNQPISAGVLPKNLKLLQFGDYFNQPLEPRVLPSSLNHLLFGNCFNQVLEKETLPIGLESIVFGLDYEKPIEPGVLSNSLKEVTFGAKMTDIQLCKLFPSNGEECKLERLIINFNIDKNLLDQIPKSVVYLVLGMLKNNNSNTNILEAKDFPSSIKKLKILNEHQPIANLDQLPGNIKSLVLGTSIFSGFVPSTIESLKFTPECDFKRPLEHILA